jgi:FkbM family methyltransferase
MKKLKIIQLASYRGNIGDNANITGTRRMLEVNLGREIEYTSLEYLEYEPDPRWGGKKFDEEFVKQVNQHDLLLLGGGGFFELAVDGSCSGTPLDIAPEIIDQIKIPIVFYALGFHVLYGLTEERKEKFRRYLDFLFSRKNVLVSMRNDGSLQMVRKLYGDSYADKINVCPDGGFFTTVKDFFHPELPQSKKFIALQLAGDGEKYRFKNGNNSTGFLKKLAAVLRQVFQNYDYQVVLIPHIPEDLKMIDKFLIELGPPYTRKNISVAPYLHGQEAQDYIFDLYSRAQLVIGMRFHANVCPIGLHVPSIGISTYEQIENLYQELGMPQRAVRPDDAKFEEKLLGLIAESLNNRSQIIEHYQRVNQNLKKQITDFHSMLKAFIDHRRILFNTQFVWPYAAADYTLAMGLQQRGHDVLMLGCGGGLPHYCELETNKRSRPDCKTCIKALSEEFARYGLPYTTVKEYLKEEDYTLAGRLVKEFSADDLLRCELLGVPVGELARLNLFQYYHGFPFSVKGEKEETFRRMFHSAVLYTLAKKRLFDLYQPDMVVTVNGKFLQWAPLVYFARQKGSQFVTWEDMDQAPSGIGLALNGIAHEQRIDEVWAEESQKELSEEQRNELKKHFRLWADGKISVLKYYGDDTEFNQDTIRQRLNLTPGRPMVSLFLNVSWDSSSVGFEGAFDSMYGWIFNSVDYAIAHPEMDLILRSHPAELKVPDFYKNEILTCEVIKNKYVNLPDNIKLIEPDSNISSYAIADMSDVCMVYTSTMGIELALQGKKVWVAANAYYSGKGFTVDLKSREHMVELLNQRPFDNILTPQQIKVAEKFAHIVRLRRVFSVPYLDISKRRFDFPGREAFAPGGNPVVDKMCSYVLTGRPFLDIGREVPADSACGNTAVETPGEYVYQNLKIRYDSLPSLQTEIKNIFEQKIYDFKTDKKSPLVIDGGAHLGIFSLYIKQKYPQARIIAFEPDQRAFDLLNANLADNHCDQVHTVKSGLFNQNTILRFAGDGADGGAIKADGSQEIQVVKLSDYIREEVDYLKLNIEGAELEVLEEIEPKLGMVKELCLEYHAFPEIGQRLHQILNLLDRNGFRYLIHDFDKETNPATKPPFSISQKSRFYLLVYAKRIFAKTKPLGTEPLKLLKPVSRKFGFDRGTPIDRIFIDQFLSQNSDFIRGAVLEIAESTYTKKFGSGVTKIDILHATPGNPKATLIGNLETGENIPENRYDCIILTQTLHVIYDYRSVIKNCRKALKENGVLLLTAPGISQISRYDMDRWGDYWRFTTLSLKKILGEQFGEENVEVRNFGNYQLAAEFLNGRSAEEVPSEAFAVTDDDYQLLLGVTAVRKKCVNIRSTSQDNQTETRVTQAASKQGEEECAGVNTVMPGSLSRPSISEHPLVLLYHRVADEPLDAQYLAVSPANFKEHLRELKSNYRTVPLRQLLEESQTGKTIPNTAALTFDDGYLDNLTQALPLLEKYGIHVTIFITAANVEQSRGFWWDRLEYLFLGSHVLPEVLDLNDNETNYKWPLHTTQQKLAAYDRITALLKTKPEYEIEEFVGELLRWAGLNENPGHFKPVLNISQLRQLSQSPHIEIGSHTLTHARLSALPVEQQKIEIVESRRKLESWIGKPVTILSYPYGAKADFTGDTKVIARQAGFQYAIANIQGSVSPNTDIFEVPRRLVRNWPGTIFAEWMRSKNKDLLEKQTLAQRTESIARFISAHLSNTQRAGYPVMEQEVFK